MTISGFVDAGLVVADGSGPSVELCAGGELAIVFDRRRLDSFCLSAGFDLGDFARLEGGGFGADDLELAIALRLRFRAIRSGR